MAKITKAAKAETATHLTVAAKIDVNEGTPIYYVNYAEVGFTEHEFSISFARMPSKPSIAVMEEAQRTGEIVRDAEVQVILPPTLMPALFKAMQSQIEGFEKMNGPLPKKEEK